MTSILQRIRQRLQGQPPSEPLDPEGASGVALRGHRDYVGGHWEEIGQLQFNFLCDQGLRPEHILLDIACGSLRLGVKAIPYLGKGHYLGIEKERSLIEAGLEQELGQELRLAKAPRILEDRWFRFERFGLEVDMAIAQSLFTHLPPQRIEHCLHQLRPVLRPSATMFATFHEVPQERRNPDRAHDHGFFAYTRGQMEAFGQHQGYTVSYLGAWGHPRGQVMVAYRPEP